MINETTTIAETVETTVETAKRGRPIVVGSARQTKLAAQAAKVANGETISRGRPTNPESNRQARLAAQAARAAAGIEIKVGRPKMVKVEETKAVEAVADVETGA
jgi:hypothetical protein